VHDAHVVESIETECLQENSVKMSHSGPRKYE
jgi:hypothetical protein